MTVDKELPAELVVQSVSDLRGEWLQWLDQLAAEEATVPPDRPLVLDGSRVVEVDGAGVQSLLALRNELAMLRRPMAVAAASETLAKALAAFGVLDLLEPASPDVAS